MSFARRRGAVEQACRALEGLSAQLWQCQGSELGPFMALVDRLGEQVEASRVAVLAEAVDRGETGPGTHGAHAWLLEWAPSFRAGGSARVVKVVDAVRETRYAGLAAAVLAARVPVGNAACVVDEFERIAPRLRPEAVPAVLDGLVVLAEDGGRREIRELRHRLIATYGCTGELQAGQNRLREQTLLSQPFDDGSGLFEYRMVVDVEAKAVIEAAVGALSAPRPAEGEPDRRPSGQRRFEALLEVVRRGVASAEGVPTTTKAQLFVTMSLADLVTRVGAGTVFGSAQAGTLLGPETVRRLACDGGVVPTVLGSKGEILDLGATARLFSPAQTRALWLRDGGCSFPDCTVPASWCDAHHLWHWSDGGPTGVNNAALLCGRHHTVVHTKGFHGEVVDGQVLWDLTPGSYDHWLAARRAAAGDATAGTCGADGRVDGVDLHEAHPAGGVGANAAPAVRAYDVWGQLITGAGDSPPPPRRP
jgi:hypothetical protein